MVVCYKEVKFDTKLSFVLKNVFHYREVSAISVRYRAIFLWEFDYDSIRSYE